MWHGGGVQSAELLSVDPGTMSLCAKPQQHSLLLETSPQPSSSSLTCRTLTAQPDRSARTRSILGAGGQLALKLPFQCFGTF